MSLAAHTHTLVTQINLENLIYVSNRLHSRANDDVGRQIYNSARSSSHWMRTIASFDVSWASCDASTDMSAALH